MKKLFLNGSQLLSGDPTLKLNRPWMAHPGLQITATGPGSTKWVSLPLPLCEGDIIKEVTIHYQSSAARTYISRIRIGTQTAPAEASVSHDESTRLGQTSPSFHTSKVYSMLVKGSVTVSLRLNFASTSDMIEIGAIAIGYD